MRGIRAPVKLRLIRLVLPLRVWWQSPCTAGSCWRSWRWWDCCSPRGPPARSRKPKSLPASCPELTTTTSWSKTTKQMLQWKGQTEEKLSFSWVRLTWPCFASLGHGNSRNSSYHFDSTCFDIFVINVFLILLTNREETEFVVSGGFLSRHVWDFCWFAVCCW